MASQERERRAVWGWGVLVLPGVGRRRYPAHRGCGMQARLVEPARRYMWWSSPDAVLADRRRFVAQVMAIGT